MNYSNQSGKTLIPVIIIVIVIIIATVVLYYVLKDENKEVVVNTTAESTNTNLSATNLTDIAATVVNIFCPFYDENITLESEGYGGSGTIFTSDGIIVTNSHIIPQDDESLDISEIGCFVTIPNPETGFAEEIYLADPIVFTEISDTYDLAFLEIYAAYEDEEFIYGTFPNTFPTPPDDNCHEECVKLGEEVRILGYPLSSGGYNLTVTEGVVSGFTEDGYILTSAKVDEGNSGGLAIDAYGCSIGIPSAVSVGEYENMGIIISLDIFESFLTDLEEYLE